MDEIQINNPVLVFQRGRFPFLPHSFSACCLRFQVTRDDVNDSLNEGARESAGAARLEHAPIFS